MLSKKALIINCSGNSKNLKGFYFFFQNSIFFFQTKSVFFFSLIAFINLFELSVGYVFSVVLLLIMAKRVKLR